MICKKCGKQLADGAKFCGGCGAPVEEAKQEIGVETEKKKVPIAVIVSAAAVLCVILAGLALFVFRGKKQGEDGPDGNQGETLAEGTVDGNGEENSRETSWEDLEPLYSISDVPTIDIYAQNHVPAEKAQGISWDSTLFYWLEDIDQTSSEDGYIAGCRIGKTLLRDAQDGGLIQYEIYRDPQTAEIYKIVSIRQNGDLVDLVDYYYQGGKPNFIFARQDSAYTPTYATPRKTGERYYFNGDVMARWRIIRVPNEIGEYTLSPSQVSYSQADYFTESEEIRNIYDDTERRMLNAAYNTYETIQAQSATGSLDGYVKDTAGNALADVTVDVFRKEDDTLLYRTTTREDGSFHMLSYLDGSECYIVVRGNDTYQDSIAYGILLSEAGIVGTYGNMILHRADGDEYPVQIQVYAAADVRSGEDGTLQRAAVPEASVSLRQGTGAYDGTVLATWKADAEGLIKTSLPSGTYTAQIDAHGFAVSYMEVVVAEQETTAACYVLPSVPEGSTGIVLTWEDASADLDLTVFTPWQASDGDMAHVGGKTSADGHGNYLVADNKAGCEVLYINSAQPGSYKLYVSNYTDSLSGSYASAALSALNVHVYIYDSTGFVSEYAFPAGQTGVVWEVAEINGGQPTPGQRVYSQLEGKNWWTVNKDELVIEECPALQWLLEYGGLEYSYDKWFAGENNWNPWLLYDYAAYGGRGSVDYIERTQVENDEAIRSLHSDDEAVRNLHIDGQDSDFFKDYFLLMNLEQIEHVVFSATGNRKQFGSLYDVAADVGYVWGDYAVFGTIAAAGDFEREYKNFHMESLGNSTWEVTADRIVWQGTDEISFPINDARVTFTVFRNPDSCFDGYSVRDVRVENVAAEWAQAYAGVLRQAIADDNSGTYSYGLRSQLIYLDADEIPELVISDDYNVLVYTYRNGQPDRVVEFGIGAHSGGFFYKPYSDIVSSGIAYTEDGESSYIDDDFYSSTGNFLYSVRHWTDSSGDSYTYQDAGMTNAQTITQDQYDGYREGFLPLVGDLSAQDVLWYLEGFLQ